MPNAWELHSNQKISSSSTHNPENPQGWRPHRLQPHPHKDMKHFDRKPTNPEYPQPKSDIRSVLLDPTIGALSGLRPGGFLVDMTTSEPSLAVEISSLAVDSIFAHKSGVGLFIKGALKLCVL
ncbi:hypothetical protein ACFX15_006049 [Malus domestica]